MNNSDLSRKIAKLINIMIAQGMTINDRYELIDEIDVASNVNELSKKYQEMIKKAERYLKTI